MKKLEVDKGWLWVVAITYLVYTIAMLLPLFIHLYTLSLLGVNNASTYEQVYAMETLAFVWAVSTIILPVIGILASQIITLK